MNEKIVYKVDKLQVAKSHWPQFLVVKQSSKRSSPVKKYCRQLFINPVLWITTLIILLVVPSKVLHFISRDNLYQNIHKFLIRLMDVFGALLGFVFSLPFFIIVPILIKLDSPGPVFYKQMRVGADRRKRNRRVAKLGAGKERRCIERRKRDLYGETFYIVKFRTMRNDAEKPSGPIWAAMNDPRVTRIGGWLRKYHLDEIPQFWNVLKGNMSLVGPRPERPEIIDKIMLKLPEYKTRLTTKPGITGPAQIFLGYDSCLDDIKRKIKFDQIYVDHLGLRIYFIFLLLTVIKILSDAALNDVNIFNFNITNERDYQNATSLSH
jgi:lipopolysaccharide/colanic/teichoic acid biosynthesis glycosyltransferase